MRTLVLLVFAINTKAWAAAGCAPTVESAVRGDAAASGDRAGYRVAAMRDDALRDMAWAMVETCGHPEVPLIAVSVPRATGLRVGAVVRRLPVVHIGDEVTVLARTERSQMVFRGWAEESGAVEAKVRVRLPRLSEDEGLAAPKIECRVTGVGSVEVVQ